MASLPSRAGGQWRDSAYRLTHAAAYREHLRDRCRSVGRALGLVIALIGCVTALGHIMGVRALSDFGLGGGPMRATGALTSVAIGWAMWLTPARDRGAGRRARLRSKAHLVIMGGTLIIGVVYIVLVAAGVHPDVTLGGSIAVVLVAVMGLLQHGREPVSGRVAVTLATVVGLGAALFIIAHFFGAPLVADPTGEWLPLPSAIAIALATVGVMLLVPEHGLLGFATRSSAASELLRMMVPAAVLGPVVPGTLVYLAARAHALQPGLEIAVLVCSMVVLFGLLLTWCASRITREDTRRMAISEEIVRARDGLELRVAERTRELGLTSSRYRAVFDGVNASITVVGPDRRIIDVNLTCLRWLGRERDELVGQSPLILHDAVDAQRRARLFEAETGRPLEDALRPYDDGAELGRPRVSECLYQRRDGSTFPVLLSVSRIIDDAGLLVGFVGIAVDITVQRAAEAALVNAKNAAEAAMRSRADFLARMSHEIRTPLNGVLGLTALALETTLDPEQRDYISGAREAAASLLGLIDDILDFSKIDAGKLSIEHVPIELRQVLGGSLRGLALRGRAKGLALRLDVPESVPDRLVGDPTRLTQVLVNLIGNAIKFTHKGEVSLAVDVVEVDGERVTLRFKVSDTGIGIPPEKQALIFEAFSQADEATTRKFGGTGLGLAICAQLVHMMGGHLDVMSAVGRGSTFTFSLPFAVRRSTHLTPATSPKPRLPFRALRVLVAEDNPVNLVLVTRLLERAGHTVTGVSDGRRAVEQALAGGYDAVLMDVQMPELDGLEATRAIRAAESSEARLRIVGLTAQAMAGDDRRCLDSGMDAYLSKPFEAHALLAVLESGAAR